jgi:hypothetical protein
MFIPTDSSGQGNHIAAIPITKIVSRSRQLIATTIPTYCLKRLPMHSYRLDSGLFPIPKRCLDEEISCPLHSHIEGGVGLKSDAQAVVLG